MLHMPRPIAAKKKRELAARSGTRPVGLRAGSGIHSAGESPRQQLEAGTAPVRLRRKMDASTALGD